MHRTMQPQLIRTVTPCAERTHKKEVVNVNCRYVSTKSRLYQLVLIQFMINGCTKHHQIQSARFRKREVLQMVSLRKQTKCSVRSSSHRVQYMLTLLENLAILHTF